MAWIEGVRGVLLDVDGTLLVGERPVPGAGRLVERLREQGFPLRLTTNTTRKSRAAVAEDLRRAGIPASPADVISPALLARRHVLGSGRTRAALLVPAETRADFPGVEEDETRPDWVIVGDLGPGFTWERLNAAFRQVRGGAGLIALQKNRFWHSPEGTVLDAGPFVAALEYGTGAVAEVMGKPSPRFFELALAELGLAPAEVLVVGDDAEADVAGGSRAGCRTALVRTGKGSAGGPAGSAADLVLDSVADLL